MAELVSIDGSFKAGRNRDKPGIIFPASPTPARRARSAGACGASLFGRLRRYQELLAAGAGFFARKYYAPEIGVFLEVGSEGDRIQLTNCNLNPPTSPLLDAATSIRDEGRGTRGRGTAHAPTRSANSQSVSAWQP